MLTLPSYTGNALSELTICSVSYKHSKHLLQNIINAKKLNPNSELKWLIVNNALDEDSFESILQLGDENIQVFNGVPNNFNGSGSASKHHASGLDLIVKRAKTRFVLILDPDFYLVMPNWVERITKYMTDNNISLFGVPWHPKWTMKWRYFPCVHCTFVDRKNLNLSSLSFMPEFENTVPDGWRYFLSKIPFVGNRAYIGTSMDTGSQIYKKYFGSTGVNYESVTPSFSHTDVYNLYSKYNKILVYLWIMFNKILDCMLPEKMSVFPKKKNYFTKTSFSDLKLSDCKKFGWEEFIWNNEPFGFHIRGFRKEPAQRIKEIDRIQEVLRIFINRCKCSGL